MSACGTKPRGHVPATACCQYQSVRQSCVGACTVNLLPVPVQVQVQVRLRLRLRLQWPRPLLRHPHAPSQSRQTGTAPHTARTRCSPARGRDRWRPCERGRRSARRRPCGHRRHRPLARRCQGGGHRQWRGHTGRPGGAGASRTPPGGDGFAVARRAREAGEDDARGAPRLPACQGGAGPCGRCVCPCGSYDICVICGIRCCGWRIGSACSDR